MGLQRQTKGEEEMTWLCWICAIGFFFLVREVGRCVDCLIAISYRLDTIRNSGISCNCNCDKDDDDDDF